MAAVGDLVEQFGQVPGAHQRALQVVQLDVENLQLGLGRTQPRILDLTLQHLPGQPGRAAPHQHLGEIVQHRGLLDHLGVGVQPMDREAEREECRTMSATNHFIQASQRDRIVGQQVFDHRRRLEVGKKPRQAHHHDGGHRGFGVGDRAAGAVAGSEHQDAKGEQRIALGQPPDRHAGGPVVILDHFRNAFRTVSKNRDFELAQAGHPGGEVEQGTGDHGDADIFLR